MSKLFIVEGNQTNVVQPENYERFTEAVLELQRKLEKSLSTSSVYTSKSIYQKVGCY
ncbi:MAG: hypothetical protein SCK57_03705 [Bacillota bacterium]|nr:hypothetical protein [Bacillota bacterium]MDW7676744.1 hypothetical protein [Bacillota bacterium]